MNNCFLFFMSLVMNVIAYGALTDDGLTDGMGSTPSSPARSVMSEDTYSSDFDCESPAASIVSTESLPSSVSPKNDGPLIVLQCTPRQRVVRTLFAARLAPVQRCADLLPEAAGMNVGSNGKGS